MTFFGMTIITAVATVVLAVFAIVTALYARRAFLKQSEEVSILQRQAKEATELLEVQSDQLDVQRDQFESLRKINEKQTVVLDLQARELQKSLEQRERNAEREHRAQATFVFIDREPFEGRTVNAPTPPSVTAEFNNRSNLPVYKVELWWHQGPGLYGDPNPERLGTMMPGATGSWTRKFPPGSDVEDCGAFIRFTDAAGTRWQRRADGHLEEFAEPRITKDAPL